MSPFLAGVVDWLGTFALHSTVALASAWTITALLRDRASTWQEAILRLALWLPLVSASLQCALRGTWAPELRFALDAGGAPASELLDANAAPAAGDAVAIAASWWSSVPWPLTALAVAAASTFGGAIWLWRVHRRLGAVLRTRRPETEPRVLAAAAEVARALGLMQSPHVSRTAAIATPIAFGSLRPEICLPLRAGELHGASLRAMLAHEVAHLRAADPAWMWAAAWLQALFPWQPLLIVVRRRWARLVELRCDAVAAELATPTAVARCLLDVADWLRPGSERTVAALGMAARPSALRERVEAVLRGPRVRFVRRRAVGAVGLLAVAALTAAAPAVAIERSADDTLFALPLPSPESSAADALLDALRDEHDLLQAEADALRAELATQPAAPELARMLALVDERLRGLAAKRARLATLLAPDDFTNH